MHVTQADGQVCSCSGYRYISLVDPDDLFSRPDPANEPRPQDLLMLDFSPYSVKRARSKGVPATSDHSDIDMSPEEDGEEDEEDNEEDWIDDDMSIDSPYQTQIQTQTRTRFQDLDRSHPRFSHEPLEVDIIDDLSCIEMGECWKEDIWSGLPYVRIRKEMGIVASGVMIDDQRVMMISVSLIVEWSGELELM